MYLYKLIDIVGVRMWRPSSTRGGYGMNDWHCTALSGIKNPPYTCPDAIALMKDLKRFSSAFAPRRKWWYAKLF